MPISSASSTAFSETLAEMQAADFLPERADTPRTGRDASGREAWFVPDPDRPGKYLQVADCQCLTSDISRRSTSIRSRQRSAVLPLTEPQREMCAAALMGDEANCSYNQCFLLQLRGPLSVESMRNALADVVRRHEALRAFDRSTTKQTVLRRVANPAAAAPTLGA